jgi:hypothetical protein
MPLLQEGGYPYGWAAGEHIYKEVNGLMVWSHLKDFHPNDAFILTLDYHPVGVRIKNIREKQPVDLWFASGAVPAKAAWYPHRPRFNQFYGRSQLIGAWLPWRMLGWRDGIDQVVNAATPPSTAPVTRGRWSTTLWRTCRPRSKGYPLR